jgi:hypothetical protein
LWEANELFDYWQDYPPTHVLVAAYLRGGSKGLQGRSKKSGSKTTLDELAQAVATAGGGTNKKLPQIYKA